MDRQCIGQRMHAGKEGPACARQLFGGFQHYRKFDDIEAGYAHERTRAVAGGDGAGLFKGITAFAQAELRKTGGQVKVAV